MKKQLLSVLLAAFLSVSFLFAAAAAETMPEERLLPRLVDQADLLTEEEEAELLGVLDEISERQECDVIVTTVSSLEGKTAEAFADDTYDYNGYGFGATRDGILLLISMEERDWWISTRGEGTVIFTDAGLDYITEKFKPMLSGENYQGAFLKYAELCDEFISQAVAGEPYDVDNMPKGTVSPFWIFGDLAIGCLIARGMANRKRKRLKTVKKKKEAGDYVVSGTLRLNASREYLVNKRVTTRTVSSGSDSDSRGGSTVHTSSSGATHGGTGGKF